MEHKSLGGILKQILRGGGGTSELRISARRGRRKKTGTSLESPDRDESTRVSYASLRSVRDARIASDGT